MPAGGSPAEHHPCSPPPRTALAGSSAAYRSRVVLRTHIFPYPPCGRPLGPLTCVSTLPSADFSRPVRMSHCPQSRIRNKTGDRPTISPAPVRAQPPDLHRVPLMDTNFAVVCPLVRPCLPRLWFLSISSHFAPRFFPDSASRHCPC